MPGCSSCGWGGENKQSLPAIDPSYCLVAPLLNRFRAFVSGDFSKGHLDGRRTASVDSHPFKFNFHQLSDTSRLTDAFDQTTSAFLQVVSSHVLFLVVDQGLAEQASLNIICPVLVCRK